MRYHIRRITPGSALRIGCALGWLVTLCPALCLAGLATQVLQSLSQATGQVEPIEIVLLGRPVVSIDLLETLRLSAIVQTINRLVAQLPLTFGLLALALTLVGAAILAVTALLFSLGYNLLATIGGGLEIELQKSRSTDRTEDT